MRNNLLVPLAVSLLLPWTAFGQKKAEGQLTIQTGREVPSTVCADLPGQTSGTHRFRQLGETFEISLRGDKVPARVADCEPVALDLQWANGRNNGSNFNVTFLDSNNRPIYARQISGFRTGVLQFPLSSFDRQPMYGSSPAMISVPMTVTIQAVRPFAAPANLSYTVTRVAHNAGSGVRSRRQEEESGQGNEIVSIHRAVRLIGASRLPVVQIELKTNRPFPVRDVPLQLQIGNKIFVDELSGDYTGRKLTLSLTPELFAEIKDGAEIVAFFSKPFVEGDVWYFGKLSKTSRQEQ